MGYVLHAHVSIILQPLTYHIQGHTKAGSALACKLARTRSTRISLLVADYLYEKVLKELNERFIRGIEDDLKDMIRYDKLPLFPLLGDCYSKKKRFSQQE